ncbi:hypothetical protein KY331_04280 [Candidatus Woesearchaeota archaeon]|nr:hypothetical protein [Candidatus Woesearchaeota archaeon]
MKILSEADELKEDTLYILGDRHGYDSQGVDTLHRDVVTIIAKAHYGINISDEELTEILGSFENPNNLIKGLEYQVQQRGIEVVHPDKRIAVVSVGDLVCSRKPGEMKTRNVVGKAAKEARLKGINQYVALVDLMEKAMKDEEQKDKMYELAKKFSSLTSRRFESMKGVEDYINFRHLLGNADLLPSVLISTIAPELETLVDIYQNSGVFEDVVDNPAVIYDKGLGFVFVPYSIDFNESTRHFRQNVRVNEEAEHLLFTHETLDTNAVGDGRNVEGRELYNLVISRVKPLAGFSGDTHEPTTKYQVKVGDIELDMVQVSPKDVLCYEKQ